jgi:hypothetical protein
VRVVCILSVTLTQLQLGNKLPSFRIPLPTGEGLLNPQR